MCMEKEVGHYNHMKNNLDIEHILLGLSLYV